MFSCVLRSIVVILQKNKSTVLGVNELQTQLLQKIEELTLYIIQQEERIKQQDLRIKALEQK